MFRLLILITTVPELKLQVSADKVPPHHFMCPEITILQFVDNLPTPL
jgi:hypothetical protein